MKLTYTSGCTVTSLDVDGKEFNIDLTPEERIEIATKILSQAKSHELFDTLYYIYIWGELYDEPDSTLEELEKAFQELNLEEKRSKIQSLYNKWDNCQDQDIFINFLEIEGEGGYQYTCSQCGDSVYVYKINIT